MVRVPPPPTLTRRAIIDCPSPAPYRDVVGERHEEEYSVVWGVKRLLSRIHVVMVRNHLVEDRSNRAVGRRDCCAHTPGICLEYFDASRSVKWWSFYPSSILYSRARPLFSLA